MLRSAIPAATTALAALLALLPAPARAGLMITDFTQQEVKDPQEIFTIDVSLVPSCTLMAGDFLTFYDVIRPAPAADMVLSHSEPANWTFTLSPVGLSPVNRPTAEDPDLINIVWTYSGPNLSTPQAIGSFVVDVEQVGPTRTTYAISTQCGGGSSPENTSALYTPRLVPEPGSVALVALGAAAIGLTNRRRRGRGAAPSRTK